VTDKRIIWWSEAGGEQQPSVNTAGKDPVRALIASWARPIYVRTEGAPYQPGQRVLVVASIEPPEVADVSEYIGLTGTVEHLEYSCGCGQKYPGDPMIGVRFQDGRLEEFWFEELKPQ